LRLDASVTRRQCLAERDIGGLVPRARGRKAQTAVVHLFDQAEDRLGGQRVLSREVFGGIGLTECDERIAQALKKMLGFYEGLERQFAGFSPQHCLKRIDVFAELPQSVRIGFTTVPYLSNNLRSLR
jgi:hypothetical protein